jgi:hypothetical protein
VRRVGMRKEVIDETGIEENINQYVPFYLPKWESSISC